MIRRYRVGPVKGFGAGTSNGRPERQPLHWPLEFPEVFDGQRGGFDAIVGNPPFLGGKLISGAFGTSYQKYLVTHVTLGKRASVDLVVHFLIRVGSLLRRHRFQHDIL
jgi:hypothetical protein